MTAHCLAASVGLCRKVNYPHTAASLRCPRCLGSGVKAGHCSANLGGTGPFRVESMNYDAKIDAASGAEDSSYNPLVAGDAEERASSRRMWIIGAVAAVLMIGLWFLLHHKDAGAPETSVAAQAPVVTVIAPGR